MARRKKEDAEKTLREIAPGGPPEAWLNLALYYLSEEDERAFPAAEEYLKTQPDPVVAEIVRSQFGLAAEDTP